MTKNEIIVRNVILEEYVTPISNYDGRFTKTTQFMLPSVGVNIKNKLIFEFFVNAYLNDVDHKHLYERPIFVLFAIDNFSNLNWKKVYSALITSENYITDYDCGTQGNLNLVMIVFRVPDKFAKDYYHFKKGRYSKFSEEYKSKFPEYIKNDSGKDSKSVIWQIINKCPNLKTEIAKMFVCKRSDGSLYNEDDLLILKKQLDSQDEIWDLPNPSREYYKHNFSKVIER